MSGGIPIKAPTTRAAKWKLLGVSVAAFALGLAGLYVGGYQVYMQILDEAPEIELNFKLLFVSPLFVVFGILALVLLLSPKRPIGPDGKPVKYRLLSTVSAVLLIGALPVGAALYFWLRSVAKAHGYDL